MAEREGDDPLLDQRRELLRLPRPSTFARAQNLEPMPLDPSLPAVVGRTVDPEDTTSLSDGRARREIEELQPVAEDDVIL